MGSVRDPFRERPYRALAAGALFVTGMILAAGAMGGQPDSSPEPRPADGEVRSAVSDTRPEPVPTAPGAQEELVSLRGEIRSLDRRLRAVEACLAFPTLPADRKP